MGSHATAMGIAVIAYVYARRRANDLRFSFGTGKVNSLAAFTSALLLAVFALMMVHESVDRFMNPVTIEFNQAILVTVIGFIVNLASVLILGQDGHSHDHGNHDHEHQHDQGHNHKNKDQNLKAAYLHVLADTMTSVFAILALTAGKYLGLNWLDPVMGIAGAVLVASWAWGLLRDTSKVLLDHQGPQYLQEKIHEYLKDKNAEVVDLHLWAIGPERYSLAVSLITNEGNETIFYKALAQIDERIVHTTVEVHSK
jgi:cation diffusion facilitator family transporter